MKTRTTVINNSKTAKILESIRLQSDEAKNLLRIANNEIKEENTKLRKEVQDLREEVCRLKADNVDTKNKLFEATETVPLLNKPGVDCTILHTEECVIDRPVKSQADNAYEASMDVIYKGD